MKEVLKSLVFVLLVLLAVGCATKVANSVAHTDPVPTKAEVLDNFTSDQLVMGETLFANNCDKCHKLFEPNSKTPEEWNEVLKRMFPRTKLNFEETKLVRAYLVANSQ